MHETIDTTIWDVLGEPHLYDMVDTTHRVRVGRSYYDGVFGPTPSSRVRVERLECRRDGLHLIKRYLDPDTPVQLVPRSECDDDGS